MENELKFSALESGRRALAALGEAEECVKSAMRHGIADMFFNSRSIFGLIANWNKHSRMDEAQKKMNVVKAELQNFRSQCFELQNDIQVNFSSFEKCFDFFADNAIVDIVIQVKMKKSLVKIRETREVLEEILKRLENQEGA